MPDSLSRRALLRAAGGITFLGLAADGRVLAAPKTGGAVQPVFLAAPYLQPGPQGSHLRERAESVILAWETTRVPASFAATLLETGQTRTPERTERRTVAKVDGKGAYHYAVAFDGLKLATRYRYRVTLEGETLVEGFFTTRKPRGQKCRFVAFGDNALGDIHERMVAYQAYRARPDFIVNTGDAVYEEGLGNEYTRYFFPILNADLARPNIGAPLLRSVPFYTVLGNHDANEDDARGGLLDFDADPDSGGYFQCLHLPVNGPAQPAFPMRTRGAAEQVAVFRASAGARYPRMANYSFDYADAHFLCLDSSTYTDPADPALQEWIAQDLAETDAAWKFVVYHHPAFNVGPNHYQQQHMRALSPLFETHGVDIVLNGHEHTYQRTRPLRFVPRDLSRVGAVGSGERLVPGTFTIDMDFDGERNNRARGIVHITTGAAGKYLYAPDRNNRLDLCRHPEDGNIDYAVRFVTDRFSFTVFDMDSRSLTLRQVDQWGETIDRCRWTRG